MQKLSVLRWPVGRCFDLSTGQPMEFLILIASNKLAGRSRVQSLGLINFRGFLISIFANQSSVSNRKPGQISGLRGSSVNWILAAIWQAFLHVPGKRGQRRQGQLYFEVAIRGLFLKLLEFVAISLRRLGNLKLPLSWLPLSSLEIRPWRLACLWMWLHDLGERKMATFI